ncbi:FMN-binding protein [Oribacterium sp. P6A1]|uniref:FMN-binding protein n=1 Tax=Oribacterium sp. P6A1 TaxID=1410612 RepID=UPI00068B8622|nr:FMN-binding protein [Oribacterium sp. P6A1]
MKKYIITAAVGMAISLAACGNNDVPASTTQAETVKNESSEEAVKELSGSAEGFGGTITVTLKMKGDDIIEASILGNDESPEIGGKALSELEKQLVEKDGFEIDGVSGATYTSEGVRNATKDALGLFLPDMEESKTESEKQ